MTEAKAGKHVKKFIENFIEVGIDWETYWEDHWKDLIDKLHKALKVKKVKDKNAPKRPLNNYMCFCREKRPEVKAENPEFKSTEISSELGKLWRELKDKSKYNELSKLDKLRWQEEDKKYRESKVESKKEVLKEKINPDNSDKEKIEKD